MAYKYQLGDAVMSGSLTQEGSVIVDSTIRPSVRGGASLGSSLYQFGQLNLDDGAFIYFGDDSEVSLGHYHDHGLTLSTAGDNGSGAFPIFRLNNQSNSPADNDKLGQLEFVGKNDADEQITARFYAQITDVSDGTEDMGWKFHPVINGSQPGIFDISVTTPGVVTIADGAYDLNVASHDGTNGLKLAGTLVTSTAAEVNLLDGGTSVGGSITIADSDGVIVNDGGTSKLVPASDFKTFVGSLSVVSKADGGTLEVDKVNYFGDLGSSATVTLPASDNSLIGKSIYVKAKDLTSGAKIIINTQASDQKIDSSNSIELESPFASVRLVYVAADDWRIF